MSAKAMIESNVGEQLRALTADLLRRGEAILQAWRNAGEPAGQSIASSLSRAQFNDHVPAVLDCLAHTIEESANDEDAAGQLRHRERVCEHGLQRWQQGYQLHEVIREWGHLQICVADEFERYAASHPSLHPAVMPAARRAWVRLCSDRVAASGAQCW